MKTIELICENPCRRLDVFLSENSGLTRSHVQKLIAAGLVTVDGVVVTKPSSEVKQDASVRAELPPEC